jgi:iron transport multicopper oxidase
MVPCTGTENLFQASAAYRSAANTGDIESVPDSAMINGVGRYVGGPEMSWARINVTHGKRYRLRVVNTSGIAHYRFAIQDHSLTVCTNDIMHQEPNTVHRSSK